MMFVYQLSSDGIKDFAVLANSFETSESARSVYIAIHRLQNGEHHREAPAMEVVKVTLSLAAQTWCTDTVWSASTDQPWLDPAVDVVLSSSGCDSGVSFSGFVRIREKLSMWRWDQAAPTSNANSSVPVTNRTSPAAVEMEDSDLVSTASLLASTPISDFGSANRAHGLLEQLRTCYAAIGNNEDETRSILAHLLSLAHRIRKHEASQSLSTRSASTDIHEWCDRVDSISYKWTTFQLLHTSIVDGSRLRDRWTSFKDSNSLRLLEGYMKKGVMRSVMIVWSRHLDDGMIREVPKLLHLLPPTLPAAVFEKWIQREVVPAIIRHCEESTLGDDVSSPSLLHELAQWMFDRARDAAEKGDLSTALRLSGLLNSTSRQDSSTSYSYLPFKTQVSSAGSSVSANDANESDSGDRHRRLDAFQRLELLEANLRHIQHLADAHQFKISFQLFLEETPSSIAMSMMDRAQSPEKLRDGIERHVKKYLVFCKAQADKVMMEYVAEIAESIRTPQSAVEEARAIVVLDSVENVDNRADAALAFFRSVLPPYSDQLKEYVKQTALAWETVRQVEIQEHFRLMEIQDMLIAYGVKHFNIADSRNASRLLGHILGQFTRPSALEDAMRLVDAYSHLRCDRAAILFIENLLSFPPTSDGDTASIDTEISRRTTRAVDALAHVKKRKDVVTSTMLLVSLMEEVVEFGLALLEGEEQQRDSSANHSSPDLDIVTDTKILEEGEPRSFVLGMLVALVEAFLPEVQSLHECAISARNEGVLSYIASPDFVLNEKLLADLQTAQRVEVDHHMLLSVSTLRDPDRVEATVKRLFKPDTLFGSAADDLSGFVQVHAPISRGKGKGKKRAASASSGVEGLESVASKKSRLDHDGTSQAISIPAKREEERQDERNAQYAVNLARFASSVGIPHITYRSMTAQLAAQNGYILPSVRIARDLFSRRRGESARANIDYRSSGHLNRPCHLLEHQQPASGAAEMLRQISTAISWYTATHIDKVYALLRTPRHLQTSSQLARTLAPKYSLELLRYSICVCEMASFEETFVLLKNAALLDEALRFTQFDVTDGDEQAEGKWAEWKLYGKWFRGDASVLPVSDTMRHATRFAIVEHKNLVSTESREDLIASKRYVSFLVENSADLLSLKVLLSMRVLPEDAISVVQSQVAKLLSTVFQSQEIDNFFALGCVHLLLRSLRPLHNRPLSSHVCCCVYNY